MSDNRFKYAAAELMWRNPTYAGKITAIAAALAEAERRIAKDAVAWRVRAEVAEAELARLRNELADKTHLFNSRQYRVF